MAARIKMSVRYVRVEDEWHVIANAPALGGTVRSFHRTKGEAIHTAVEFIKDLVRRGEKVELVIYTKSGKIVKGPSGRRTYPRSSDPKGRG